MASIMQVVSEEDSKEGPPLSQVQQEGTALNNKPRVGKRKLVQPKNVRESGSSMKLLVDGIGWKTRLDSVIRALRMHSTRNIRLWPAWYILKVLLNTGNFYWDENGEMVYNEVPVEGSNVLDLILAVINTDEKIYQLPGGLIFLDIVLQSRAKIFKLLNNKTKTFISKGKIN